LILLRQSELMQNELLKGSGRPCADLHCHSTVSDGVLAPEALAQRAQAQGVQLWALTDHDEIAGIAAARQAAESLALPFLAGVEVSVTWCGRTVHVVGLGIDDTDPTLLAGLAQIREGRVLRAQTMGQRFSELGFPGTYEGALEVAGNPGLISRTHFARYLVQSGHFSHMQAVFDRYLKDDGPAAVPTQWATLEQALEWIHAAFGVAVIAHPGRYRFSQTQFDALFSTFKDLGGLAIEVNTGSHEPWQFQTYGEVAKRYGFLASCGSDFHGPEESRCDLGQIPALHRDLTPVWQAPALQAYLHEH
jgi:predicted metal-dependent phosphoesterase TrpH